MNPRITQISCVLSGGEDTCAAPQGGSGRSESGLCGGVSGSGVPHHDPVNGNGSNFWPGTVEKF